MAVSILGKHRTDWRFPLAAAACSFLAVLSLAVSNFFDIGIIEILYACIGVPLVGLLLATFAIAKRSLTALSMLIAFAAVSYLSLRHFDDLRTSGRWIVFSKTFESQILKQPPPANGDLRHMEWDGWGFAGAGDTTVYLVYDPADSLRATTGTRRPEKPPGIPCAVYRISRMERYWYSVQFFTDTSWDRCN